VREDQTVADENPAPGAAAGTPEEAQRGLTVPEEATNLLRAAPEPDPNAPGLSPAEEAELLKLQGKAARAAAGKGAVQMRISSEHSELHYGMIMLTKEWTTVPAPLVGPLTTAAAIAEVGIEQKEEG
jgi:hypothetical protein